MLTLLNANYLEYEMKSQTCLPQRECMKGGFINELEKVNPGSKVLKF